MPDGALAGVAAWAVEAQAVVGDEAVAGVAGHAGRRAAVAGPAVDFRIRDVIVLFLVFFRIVPLDGQGDVESRLLLKNGGAFCQNWVNVWQKFG